MFFLLQIYQHHSGPVGGEEPVHLHVVHPARCALSRVAQDPYLIDGVAGLLQDLGHIVQHGLPFRQQCIAVALKENGIPKGNKHIAVAFCHRYVFRRLLLGRIVLQLLVKLIDVLVHIGLGHPSLVAAVAHHFRHFFDGIRVEALH